MNSSEKVPSFIDMLNSEPYDHYEEFATPTQNSCYSQSLDEESVEATLTPPQVFSAQKAKDKRQRTKNFTKQEDEMVISAWQNVSLDPITGVDQTNGTYWQGVHNYFMKYKDFESNRNSSSLSHRWSIIQLAVNKFHGFYNQFDGPSGLSEIDKGNLLGATHILSSMLYLVCAIFLCALIDQRHLSELVVNNVIIGHVF